MSQINDQLVLISGESATGKSASLQHIPNQERWMYLNCESGKRLPFRNKFQNFTVTDPWQVYEGMDHANGNDSIDGVIVDTLTFLMEMFESQYVLPATNTMEAWGQYGQFFKNLMQDKVASSDKAIIFLAHTKSELNEKEMAMRTAVPVKGALKNNGIEAYFSTVVSTKKVSLKDLEDYKSDLLHISETDEMLGYKHVFQTQLTKETIGERIRSPMGLFSREETFMDNDANLLLNHLQHYYA